MAAGLREKSHFRTVLARMARAGTVTDQKTKTLRAWPARGVQVQTLVPDPARRWERAQRACVLSLDVGDASRSSPLLHITNFPRGVEGCEHIHR